MEDRTFKPAGAAIAALVAGLAPAAHAEMVKPQPHREAAARDALVKAALKFEPRQPFASAAVRRNADVPFGQQLDLPFRD